MCNKILLPLLLLTWLSCESVARITKWQDKSNGDKNGLQLPPPYGVTSYDYDYQISPRRSSSFKYKKAHRTTTTTTERPLVRYWNNFMRNVRLSMPTITWNVTNPLVNFFNNEGEANAMETPVANYYTTSGQRKHTRKHKKSHTKTKRNKYRKRLHDMEEDAVYGEDAVLPEYLTGDYGASDDSYVYVYNANAGQYFEFHPLHGGAVNYQQNSVENANVGDYYDDEEIKPLGNTALSTSAQELNAQIEQQEKNSNEEEYANEENADDNNEEIIKIESENNSKDIQDDVAVVSTLEEDDFDDDDDEPLNVDKNVEATINNNHNKKGEMLRNVMGTYVNKDLVRQRHRVNKPQQVKSKKTQSTSNKQNSKNIYRYYVLKRVEV